MKYQERTEMLSCAKWKNRNIARHQAKWVAMPTMLCFINLFPDTHIKRQLQYFKNEEPLKSLLEKPSLISLCLVHSKENKGLKNAVFE